MHLMLEESSVTEHRESYADGNVLYRLSALETLVTKHDKDLYHGNGKPGLTTRMAMSEDTILSINKNLGRMVWLLVTMLLSLIGFIVEQNILHGTH